MYWPLGAPRIYAADKTRNKAADTANQDDGDKSDAVDHDPASLLGLRTSRSGHMVATITATTLTIWQTSV